MHRSKDATYINKLVNDPSIRPSAGGDGVSYIDFEPTFNTFISLEGEGSAWLLTEEDKDVYEVHCFFMPKFRGKSAVDFGKKAIKYMFEIIGAKKLIAKPPLDNRPLIIYNIAVGAAKGPTKEICIPEMNWRYLAQIFTLDKRSWLCHQQ